MINKIFQIVIIAIFLNFSSFVYANETEDNQKPAPQTPKNTTGQVKEDSKEPVKAEKETVATENKAKEPEKEEAAKKDATKAGAPEKPGKEQDKKAAGVEAKKPAKPRQFLKGELANIGSIELMPREKRVGLAFGVQNLAKKFYLALTPNIIYSRELYGSEFTTSFGVPLRFEILDPNPDVRFANAGKMRKYDWDEPGDYSKIIRYITYGRKEDKFYLDINAFNANSIGHGTIMKRYNPNLNIDHTHVSLEMDAYNDGGGFELYLNDIAGPNVVGVLGFIKPMGFTSSKNVFLKSLSLGVSFASDLKAPLFLVPDLEDADNDGREDEVWLSPENNPHLVTKSVRALGFDLEGKIYKSKKVDLKCYFDFSTLTGYLPADKGDRITFGGSKATNINERVTKTGEAFSKLNNIETTKVNSSGYSLGMLGRLNFGESMLQALRTRTELRYYDPNYLPSYFDIFYEVQRLQFVNGKNIDRSDFISNTKMQNVFGRNGNKVAGFYFEGTYSLVGYFSLAAALELSNSEYSDKNFLLHLEVPVYEKLKFITTYHKRSFEKFSSLFDFSEDNNILMTKIRFSPYYYFSLDFTAITPFNLDSKSDGLFKNIVDINVGAEFHLPF